jgi:pimeloyl-ACP methyl ester carboxylesterase
MSSRFIRAAVAVAASVALAVTAAPAATAVQAESEHRGTLPGGGAYVLYEPASWNGTLLTWSPGYGGGGGVATAGPSAEVVEWLTDQGYAVAGAAAGSGWAVEDLLAAQPEVVEVASAVLGEPQHVIAWGSSMGGQVSVALLEQSPELFDGALPLCGSIAGAIPMLNASLDGTYALKTLLAPGDASLQLVDVTDEPARQAAFRAVVETAQQTPEGRARIALAATLAQMPTWSQAGTERPAKHDIHAQQEQLYRIFMWGAVSPRQPLEQRAGGNFSWNTGVDYVQALRDSRQHSLVRDLYREAGLSLQDDLATLNAGERIAADAEAVAYMQRNATPTGAISDPVLSLHETGDAAPTVGQAGTYADRVRAHGGQDLVRQAFVDRPGHCNYADAEVAAMVTALQERLDTGRWDNVAQPRALNARADEIAAASGLERGGSFAQIKPGAMLRPEREPAP